MLLNTGSEANEVALKLAKMVTGRWEVVGLTRSLPRAALGDRVGQLLDGARGLRAAAARLVRAARAVRVPLPDPPLRRRAATARASRPASSSSTSSRSGRSARVVAEPVLSAGGIIVPPDGYFRRVRELCDARGMLLVMDEAQTGFGRLGTMFGFEHDGARARLPRGLEDARRRRAAGRDAHERGDRGRRVGKGFLHVTSHVSDPLPAAAGLAVLDVIEEDGLVARAARARRLPARHASASWPTGTSRSATSAAAASSSGSSSSRTASRRSPRTRSARR